LRGQRKEWADVEKSPEGSGHPVVYVALGSLPGARALGTIPIPAAPIPPFVRTAMPSLSFLQVADEVLGRSAGGAIVGPPGSGEEPSTIDEIDRTAWSTFGRFWGDF
jgi:hypothetical protein